MGMGESRNRWPACGEPCGAACFTPTTPALDCLEIGREGLAKIIAVFRNGLRSSRPHCFGKGTETMLLVVQTRDLGSQAPTFAIKAAHAVIHITSHFQSAYPGDANREHFDR